MPNCREDAPLGSWRRSHAPGWEGRSDRGARVKPSHRPIGTAPGPLRLPRGGPMDATPWGGNGERITDVDSVEAVEGAFRPSGPSASEVPVLCVMRRTIAAPVLGPVQGLIRFHHQGGRV